MSRLQRIVPLAGLALLLVTAPAVHAAPAAAPGAAKAPATRSKPAAARATRSPQGASAAGRISPEAEALIAAINTNYRGLTSYDFQGNSHMVVRVSGQQQVIEVPFRLAAAKPSRLRNEIMNPIMPNVTVSDGSKTWVFLPGAGQYTEKDAAPLSSTGASEGDIGNALAAGTPLQRYLSAHEGLISARVVGEQTITVVGASVRCVVVDAQYATPDSTRFKLSPNRFWIDRARRLVMRDSLLVKMSGPNGEPVEMSTLTTFNRLDINHVLPDTMFAFHPPATAKKVESFQQQGMQETVSPLVGKPASDFSLKDLDGKKQSLSSLKGKVVLLDFWATWCGPCRRELPTIAKLHKELADKGLAVVAVNVGEPLASVNAFLRKNAFELPVWLDSDSEVSQRYSANSIPTLVVIDKTGKVSAYKVGLREEAELRSMLEAAGLE